MGSLTARIVISTLLLGAASRAAAPLASALAQRTFVASYGLDTNPCSLTSPCRSFGAAINATTVGGEVIVQDSAGYGPVTITKSTSIIAPAGVYAGISAGPGHDGITVNAPGATVVLRGLSINGIGGADGIHFASGASLRIENCIISNMNSAGIRNDANGSEIVILDTIVRDNGGGGISVVANGFAVIDGVRVEHNGGDGISLSPTTGLATASIERSVTVRNAAAGITVLRALSPARMDAIVDGCNISQNAGDGLFVGGTIGDGDLTVAVSRSAIARNALSGISFLAPGGSTSYMSIVDNRFVENPNGGIKVDGASAIARVSRNDFGIGLTGYSAFFVANGASLVTFHDNTGLDFTTGSVFTGTPF